MMFISVTIGFVLTSSCGGDDVLRADTASAPDLVAPAPRLRRLTGEQTILSLEDLVGEDVVLPLTGDLEPDTPIEGLLSVGASETTISALGVEQYETAAYSVAEQALAPGPTRDALVPCDPVDVIDDDCAADALEPFARRAWRRPVEEAELQTLVDLAAISAETLGDFHEGLVFAMGAVLQSPNFLYRQELGEPDPSVAGTRRFTSIEMASRLSFFFWNRIPDEELLAAGEAGELVDDALLEVQIERLLADDRARSGVRNFFTELYELYLLDDLTKDPEIFPHMSPEVGPSAREETLKGLEVLIFDEDEDWREIFVSQRTYLDPVLAMLYNVPAPEREGFGEVQIPEEAGRRGLLGHASILTMHAHAVSSSATLRGKFVREKLLCQTIPPPPSDVDVSIPEPTEDLPTLRDRVAIHVTDPACAGCHDLTDWIGLGLENFDGLGMWRYEENGVEIDSTGELDGTAFADAWELGEVLRVHPNVGPCVTEMLWKYASGQAVSESEEAYMEWMSEVFVVSGYSFRTLLHSLAMSPGFRQVGEVD